MSKDSKICLHYWNYHGYGSTIRFLLELGDIDYDEILYLDRDKWFNEQKKNLESSLLFPNLPFIKDGDIMMSEHLPIMRYIARKYPEKQLYPITEEEERISDQTESFVFDIRFNFYKTTYTLDYNDRSKSDYIDYCHQKLPYLNKLFENKDYVIGNRLTYVDVVVYDFLVLIQVYEESLINENVNLKKFIDQIEQLPNMIRYKSSSRWIKRRLCAPWVPYSGEM